MLKVRRTFGARVNAIAFANPSQSPSVTAPQKGEPRLIPSNTRIGAGLPLPAGEVAARSADGEGEFFTILHSQLQPRRMF